MTHKTTRILLTGTLLSMLPVFVMAELTPKAKEQIETVCKSAIVKKGYGDYSYKYVEVLKAQSGNYGMIGQLHKDTKHYEFNCALNKDIKALKIEELVINSLD